MKRSRLAAVVLTACTLCSCGAPAPKSEPSPSTTPSAMPSGADGERITHAIDDLAQRTGVDPETIDVVTHEEVTWPDSAMGCPEPGRMYTQATVPGERLVLRAQGREFAYHAAAHRPFVYCANPGPHYPADQSSR